MEILIPIVLIIVGYTFGSVNEKKHYRRMRKEEALLLNLPVEVGTFNKEITGARGQLVNGHVVIASDYFKNFASSLRSLIGGNLGNYEKLIDRGRREAIIRMKREAQRLGASRIVNMRLETARIGNNQRENAMPCIEVHAYGTAIIENK